MRGRGSFRGSQRGYGQSQGRERNTQGGPLMTSHLRELDIELEILKKKRDMIQQEHELLNREREFNLKRQYQQEASNSYSQSSSRTGYSSNFYREQGNKRQAVDMSPPRRLNPPSRVEPWDHNSVTPSKPKNYNYNPKPQSLLDLYTNTLKPYQQNPNPQIRKNFKPPPKQSLPVRKDFQPTMVTKPKIRTRYLQKPQKAEVAKTVIEEGYVLQRNVRPSPQVNGRLELALGSILKDIKQIEPELTNSPMTFYVLRMIKQIIRDRIRGVMNGQVVGIFQDIVASYRNKYPIETDAELVELGKRAQAYNLSSLVEKSSPESENPKLFFKENITKLLSTKLEEIFKHVKSMYTTSDNADVILKQMDNVADLTEKDVVNTDTSGINTDENEDITPLKKKIAKAEAYSKLMETLIESKLPRLLPKFKQDIISMLDANKEYHNTKSKVEEAAIKMAVQLVTKQFKADQKEKVLANKDIVTEGDQVVDISDDQPTQVTENDAMEDNSAITVTKPAEGITDKDVPVTINSSESAGTTNSAEPVVKSTVKPIPSTPSSKIIDFPYFVKLIGRPKLPSRQAVYEFLEQFKPASIKKHKTIDNLLVLGFDDKEGYDKILEVSEKTIGTNTMIIKASEKVSTTPQKAIPIKNNQTAEKNIEETPTPAQADESIDAGDKSADSSFSIAPELDEQITSLLTAIRHADEESSPDSEAAKSETTSKDDKEVDDQNIVANDDVSKVDEKNYDNSTTTVKDGDISNSNKEAPMETISEVDEKIEDEDECDKHKQDVKDVENKTVSDENTTSTNKAETEHKDDNSMRTGEDSNKDDTLEDGGKKNGDDVSKEDTLEDGGKKNGDDVSKEEKICEKNEEKDPKSILKESGRSTPTRTSARLATVTPSTIKTRRASKLAQNN